MRQIASGVVINCEVKPKSKVFAVTWAGDILNISLTAAAVENRANKEIVETLHEIFKRPKNQIEIIAGSKSRTKSVLIKGISEQEARNRLTEIKD